MRVIGGDDADGDDSSQREAIERWINSIGLIVSSEKLEGEDESGK